MPTAGDAMTFGDRWWWFCYVWRQIAVIQIIGPFNPEEQN